MTLVATRFPDVEELVLNRLPSDSFTIWALNTLQPWPYVADRVLIQIDCRADTKKAARELAWSARDDLVRWQFEDNSPVRNVVPMGGPKWLADLPGGPRYVVTVQITVRQTRR